MGNVIGLSDESAVLQVTMGYDDWGYGAAPGGGGIANRAAFKGTIALGPGYYMRNRWYDPFIGRFLSEDPIGIAGSLNLYSFAENDPINGSDPAGLIPMPGECEVSIDYVPGNPALGIPHKVVGWKTLRCTPMPGEDPLALRRFIEDMMRKMVLAQLEQERRSQARPSCGPLWDNPSVRAVGEETYTLSTTGFEYAAIVQRRNGALSASKVTSYLFQTPTSSGFAYPSNTLAILHGHPPLAGYAQRPGRDDSTMAVSSGRPSLVISKDSLFTMSARGIVTRACSRR